MREQEAQDFGSSALDSVFGRGRADRCARWTDLEARGVVVEEVVRGSAGGRVPVVHLPPERLFYREAPARHEKVCRGAVWRAQPEVELDGPESVTVQGYPFQVGVLAECEVGALQRIRCAYHN